VLSERLKSEIIAFGEIYHITGSEFALLFDGNHNPVKRVEYVMNVSSDKVHFNDDASCDICLCSGISRFANDKESYVE
ncbi:hypothetical protein GUG52_26020, partial [Xanthomonas citri pv. citri]|nr:hypothetical protein [Xanthomonas citri pv. citri]